MEKQMAQSLASDCQVTSERVKTIILKTESPENQ